MSDQAKVRCPWCVYNRFRCGDDEEKTCDFKSLPMEKGLILQRLKKEVGWLNEVRSQIAKGNMDGPDVESLLREASDKNQGVQIMFGVLEEKFGMSRKEILSSVGMQEASMMDKIRLSVKLGVLKAARQGSAAKKREGEHGNKTRD